MKDHDDVAVDAVHALAADAVSDVLLLQRAAVRGADQKDVLGAALGAVGLPGRQTLDGDAMHQVVEVPGIAPCSRGNQDDHQAEHHQCPSQTAPPPGWARLRGLDALTECAQPRLVGHRAGDGDAPPLLPRP